MNIRMADQGNTSAVAELMGMLWADHTREELEREAVRILGDPEAAVFLAEKEAGFAQCGLRHDYVEGTCSSPVGYLEGIFVKPEFRGTGIARALLCACEKWAKEKGCREFASDCELSNSQSLDFHLKTGFAEANRIICFTKKL